MDFLALVKALHREAKLPGSAPDTVAGQSGRAADLVEWIKEAYLDIQREKDGKWNWLFFSGGTTVAAGDDSVAVDDFALIAFNRWATEDEMPARIFRTSVGSTERRIIPFLKFDEFYPKYFVGPVTDAMPVEYSINPQNDYIFLGPGPAEEVFFAIWYWKGYQTLADDDDEPDMPEDYHMLIVYRAMVKYGYNVIAQELLARATAEGAPLYNALVLRQWHGRTTLDLPAALA